MSPPTTEQAVAGENGAAQTLPGDPARLVTLSRSTDVVISKNAVLLIQGGRAMRLSGAEGRVLGRALACQSGSGRAE